MKLTSLFGRNKKTPWQAQEVELVEDSKEVKENLRPSEREKRSIETN